MTTRPQRNEPCHCGSGKKYKKCCLNSDIEKDKIEISESEEVNDSPNSLNFWGDDELDDGFIDKPFYNTDISDIENEILTSWWSKIDDIEDPDAKTEHIKLLISENPNLVEHSGLEEGEIFDLASAYLKINKYEDFISFILYFKDKCPSAYALAEDYYNYYIIIWNIFTNKLDEIPQLLNDYINTYADKLPDVINLLEATKNYDILIPFLEANYKNLIKESDFINESIAEPLFGRIILKYLKPDFTKNDIHNLVKDINNLDIDYDSVTFNEEYWEDNLNSIFLPYKPWDTKKPNSDKKLNDIYLKISFNYLGFLIYTKKYDKDYSYYLFNKLTDVLFNHLKYSSKKTKSILNFTIRTIEKSVINLSQNMIWIEQTKLYNLLLATYYFMEYLELCGNINTNDRQKIQDEISDLYNSNYQNMVRTNEEALIFKSIP